MGRRAVRTSTLDHRSSIYRDAVAIMASDYASDLGIDEIAHRIVSSRRQLQRSFTEIGQTTYSKHLAAIRMRHAAELLATTALTVRAVAHRVGYREPAQFAKAFRRHHGVNPSMFRAYRGAAPPANTIAATGQFTRVAGVD